MSRSARFASIVLLCLLFFAAQELRAQNSSDAQILRNAWELTERAGSYDFSTQLTETTFPAPRVTAVGRTAKYQTMYLEGTADRRAETLNLSIWDDPTSVLDPEAAIEVRVNGTRAYGRAGSGDWEEIDDISGAFAPAGDAAAFLNAAKNVRNIGSERRSIPQPDGTIQTVSFERYAFTLNGELFAENMRRTLEEQMLRSGELPPGMSLGTSSIFHDSVGEGEAWIDSNGLPLRMTIDIEFPQERNGERTIVELQTDFLSFNDTSRANTVAFLSDPAGWMGARLPTQAAVATFAEQMGVASTILFVLAIIVAAAYLWPKKAYNFAAGAIATQMMFAPLTTFVDVHRLNTFLERHPAADPSQVDPDETLPEESDPPWDPTQPPLETGRANYERELQTADIVGDREPREGDGSRSASTFTSTSGIDNDQDGLDLEDENAWTLSDNIPDQDNDGLPDGAEVALCPVQRSDDGIPYNHPDNLADPVCPDPYFADTDNDGLTDSEEILYLGTHARDVDTDNDGISDYNEVHGYVLVPGGPRYYTDARNPDSDGDGIVDGVECPSLREASPWTETTICEDTNNKGVADVNTFDNDGDGVPNSVDNSPFSLLQPASYLSLDNPLELNLQNLAAGEPILVDVQLRPKEERQLSYALNVLDWPTGDNDGQIRRLVDETFGDLDSGAAIDSPAYNGDMRLSPMLEFRMAADSLDLPRINATQTVVLTDEGVKVGFVTFSKVDDDSSSFKVDFLKASSATLSVLAGTCSSDDVKLSATVSQDSTVNANSKIGHFADGSHSLRLESAGESHCVPIPSIVSGSDSVAMQLNRIGENIATIDLAQAGGSTNISMQYADTSAVYDVAIYNSSCGEKTNREHLFPPIGHGATVSVSGVNAVDLADGTHTIALSQNGAVVACRSLGNIVNGSLPTMIDAEALSMYQISVQEDLNGELLAMAPLTLQEDPVTGQRVAFNARMFYQRATTADLQNTVNVVWLVTVLTDYCPDGVCSTGGTSRPQVIHSYRDEQWYLTGINVQEELGIDVSVIYEDPTTDVVVDPNAIDGSLNSNRHLEFDDNLWWLARSLQRTFVAGQDHNDDDVRDVTLAEIKARWDSGVSYSDDQRFGIRADALNVVEFSYDQQSDLGELNSLEIPAILHSAFGDGTFNQPDVFGRDTTTVAPTLLFAQESRSRNLGLDSAADDSVGNLVTLSGNSVTMNLNPTYVETSIIASMSWKPFRYDVAIADWAAYPLADYWDRMDALYTQIGDFDTTDDTTDAEALDAKYEATADLLMAKNIYAANYLGVGNVVQNGSDLTFKYDEADDPTDVELSDPAKVLTEQGQEFGGLMATYVSELYEPLQLEFERYNRLKGKSINRLEVSEPITIRSAVGRAHSHAWSELTSDIREVLDNVETSKLSKAGALGKQAGMVGVGIASSFFDAESDDSSERAVAITLLSISAANEVIGGLQAVKAFAVWKAANPTAGGLKAYLATSQTATKAAKVLAVLGAVIEIGIAFGMFLSQMISAGVTAFSLAFNEALAGFVGTAVVAVLLAALSLTGVGAIIVAIIVIIDAVIALVCGLEPPDKESDETEDEVYSYFCKGLSGLMAELVSFFIYDQTDIININDSDRIQLEFNPYLVDPAAGFAPGETLAVDLLVRNTIETQSANGLGITYAWQFNESNTRSAAFAYGVFNAQNNDEDSQIHNTIDRGDHPNEWVDIGGDEYYIERQVINTTDIELPSAGINKLVDAYFAEGHQSPTQECVLVPVSITPPVAVPVCWVRSNDRSTYNSLGVVFDVMPTTLNEFYSLTEKDGGRALSWGQSGDVTFPRLEDADGDGLHYTIDPDDGDRDNDNDGLDDLREVQLGTDPTKMDTDEDLVNDGDEIRNGTNPLQADSDSDGLDDAGERDGWMITYNLAGDMTQVWSDPLVGDADGDAINDRREKALGFSPWVSNDPTVLDYDTDLREPYAPKILIGMDEPLGVDTFADSARPDGARAANCSGDFCPQPGITGYIGNSAYFDGFDDFLTLGVVDEVNQASPGQYVTAAWIRPSHTTGTQYILGHSRFIDEDGFGFGLEGDEIRFDLFVPRDENNFSQTYTLISEDVNIPIGEWTHVAVWSATYNSGTAIQIVYYVNGAFHSFKQIEDIATPLPTASSDELMIGALYQLNTYNNAAEVPEEEPRVAVGHFDGRIDEVALMTSNPGNFDDVSASILKLSQRQYNQDDGIVAPGQLLEYETNISNRLLGRSVDGLLYTEPPEILTPVGDFSDYENFVLGPRSGTDAESSQLRNVDFFRVSDTAATGDYEIVQEAGAIVDVPQIPVPGQFTADTIFRLTAEQTYNGQFQHRAYDYEDQRIDGANNFTLALWINPTAIDGRRGVLGYDSGEVDGYPSIQIVDGRIAFGFGDGVEWQTKTTAGTYFSGGQNEWVHVAVVYNKSTRVATIYVDGQYAEDLGFPTNPTTTGSRIEIGRSTSLGRINFSEMRVKCEEDAGNAWFDLVGYTPATDWFQIHGQSVPDDTENVVYPINKQIEFREWIRFAMCENDGDGSNHNTCDSDDDYMSSVSIALFDEPYSADDKRFSTTMHNSTCTFFKGYDDWAQLDFQYTIDSAPFEGTVKDIRLIQRALTAPEVTDLLQSDEIISRFKFNERPGQTRFEDDVAAVYGRCQITGNCPITGVEGRENVAARFDADGDFAAIQVPGVPRLIQNHLDLPEATGFSYGAWVNLDQDNGDQGDRAILSFQGGIFLYLVETSPGSGQFWLKYEDNSLTRYSSQTISADSWNHVFVTVRENGFVALYINGIYNGGAFSSGTDFIPDDFIGGAMYVGAWVFDGGGFPLPHFLGGTIDDLYIGKDVPTQTGVQAIMQGVPSNRWTFDDYGEDDSFYNYLEGQLAESLEIDGVEDIVPIDTAATYNLWEGDFTVAGWVRGNDITAAGQEVYRPIVGSPSSSSSALFFGLHNGRPLMRFQPNHAFGGAVTEIEADLAIPPEQWTHLVFMREAGVIKIFVNGTVVKTGTHNVFGQYDDFTTILGYAYVPPLGSTQHFIGRIDDFAAYDRALIAEEIVRLYNFQVTWIDEARSAPFIVDADAPSGVVNVPEFLSHAATVLLIDAEDIGSQPVATRLSGTHTKADGSPVETVSFNPSCLDADGNAVFCAIFDPPNEGKYAFGTKVFDQVGNSTASFGTSVIVDGSAPVIVPNVSSTSIRPIAVPNEPAMWTIDLTGSVVDPEIFYTLGEGNGPGSGVVQLEVTLLDANGALLGEPIGQLAELNGTNWEMNYQVQAANPTGLYTAKLVATDAVGNVSAEVSYEVIVDGTAPESVVTGYNAPQVTVGSGRSATSIPLALGADSSIQGTVDEAPDSVEDQGNIAGITTVQIAAAPRFLQGSPVVNTPLPSGTRLYLPFDEADATDGSANNSFIDLISGHVASCSGSAQCPTVGNSSRNGQALQFDGVNDRLTVPHDASITGLTNNFVVAAWIKPYSNQFGEEMIIVGTDPTNDSDGFVFKTIGSQFGLSLPGVHDYQTVSAGLQTGIWTHVAAHMKSDNSVDFYKNGRLLRNVAGSGPAVADSNDALSIGAYANGTNPFEGLIDEITVISGGLADGDLDTIMGLAPTVHLGFDQRGMGDGTWIDDSAGMGGYARFDVRSSSGSPDRTEAGIIGSSALRFDRFDELEIRGDETVLLDDVPFTLSFWVRDGEEFYIEFGNTEIENYNNSDFLFYYDSGGNTCRSEARDASGEHHIAFVADGVNPLKIYWDGEDISPAGGCMVVTSIGGGTVQYVQFSARSNTPPFDLDDVRFYQRALSQEEIAAQLPTTWHDASVAPRSFETAEAPIAIPDGTSVEVCQSINVSQVGTTDLSEIIVQPVIDHSYAGDLTMTLVTPGNGRYDLSLGQNTSAVLLADYPVNFYEGAPTDASVMGAGLFDFGQAVCRDDGICNIQPIDSLVGSVAADGTWQLCASDANDVDDGSIESWNITFKDAADWSSGLPPALEGYYDLLVRSRDNASNVEVEIVPAWSGVIDTIAPRVTLTEAFVNNRWQYDLSAADFNLAESEIALPAACDANTTVLSRELYEAPWYLSFAQQVAVESEEMLERVVSVETRCRVNSRLSPDSIITVCDLAGNCLFFEPDGTPAEARPLNDVFEAAFAVTSLPYAFSQDTSGATTASDDPTISCDGSTQGEGSVWYVYEADRDGEISVDTFGSGYDTVLAVWTGSRGNLQAAGCNDNAAGGLQSQTDIAVQAGITYYIEIVGNSSPSAELTVNVSFNAEVDFTVLLPMTTRGN